MTDPPLYQETVEYMGYDPLAPDWPQWLEGNDGSRGWLTQPLVLEEEQWQKDA